MPTAPTENVILSPMHLVAPIGCVLMAVRGSIVTVTLAESGCEQLVLGLLTETSVNVVALAKLAVVTVAAFPEPIVTVVWLAPMLYVTTSPAVPENCSVAGVFSHTDTADSAMLAVSNGLTTTTVCCPVIVATQGGVLLVAILVIL